MQYKTIVALLFVPLTFLFCKPTYGQKVQVQVNGRMQIGGPTIHSVKSSEQLNVLLQIYLEDMKSVCDLNDSQFRKLTLAGKAVGRRLFSEAAKKKQNQFGRLFNQGQKLDVQDDSLSDEDKEANKGSSNEGDKVNNAFGGMRSVSLKKLLASDTWKKAGQSILSEEQQQKWKVAKAARWKQLRKTAVAYRVGELTRLLYLRSDQIQPITELINRIEGARLVKELGTGSANMQFIIAGMGADEPKEVSAEDLKPLLSEAQLKAWKQLNQSDDISNVVGGMFGFNLNEKKPGDDGITFADKRDLTVKKVVKGSLAAEIGLQPGDLIDSVGGTPVDSEMQFRRAMKKAGQSAAVTVIRNNAEVLLEKK